MDGLVVPRINAHPAGMDGDDADDPQRTAELLDELDAGLEGPARRLASVVGDEDVLHRSSPSMNDSGPAGRPADGPRIRLTAHAGRLRRMPPHGCRCRRSRTS